MTIKDWPGCRSLVVLCVLTACSSSPRHLNRGESSSLLELAEQLEKVGNVEEAHENYLRCLEWCSGFERQFASLGLRRLVDLHPALEDSVWETERRIEERLLAARGDSPQARADMVAVATISEAWNRTDQLARYCDRLRASVPRPVYRLALKEFVQSLPEAFGDLPESDADELVAMAVAAREDHKQLIATKGLDAEISDSFESLRANNAAAFAKVLFLSHHPEHAKAVLREARAGFGPDGCAKLLEFAESRACRELRPAVCVECAALPACSEAAPAGQP